MVGTFTPERRASSPIEMSAIALEPLATRDCIFGPKGSQLMADSCCKSEATCCEPPALVLPGRKLVQAPPASGKAEDNCCPKGVPVFDGMNPRYRLILWTVIGINGVMFVGEVVAGQLAGSQALKADALDFLADTVTYGLSLAVIGASLRTRASSALAKGVSLSVMALWVFGSTVYQTLILGLPKAEVMGVIGLLALMANLGSVLLLRPTRMATPTSGRSGSARATTQLATSSSWSRRSLCGPRRRRGPTCWWRPSWQASFSPRRCKFCDRHGQNIVRARPPRKLHWCMILEFPHRSS